MVVLKLFFVGFSRCNLLLKCGAKEGKYFLFIEIGSLHASFNCSLGKAFSFDNRINQRFLSFIKRKLFLLGFRDDGRFGMIVSKTDSEGLSKIGGFPKYI